MVPVVVLMMMIIVIMMYTYGHFVFWHKVCLTMAWDLFGSEVFGSGSPPPELNNQNLKGKAPGNAARHRQVPPGDLDPPALCHISRTRIGEPFFFPGDTIILQDFRKFASSCVQKMVRGSCGVPICQTTPKCCLTPLRPPSGTPLPRRRVLGPSTTLTFLL